MSELTFEQKLSQKVSLILTVEEALFTLTGLGYMSDEGIENFKQQRKCDDKHVNEIGTLLAAKLAFATEQSVLGF